MGSAVSGPARRQGCRRSTPSPPTPTTSRHPGRAGHRGRRFRPRTASWCVVKRNLSTFPAQGQRPRLRARTRNRAGCIAYTSLDAPLCCTCATTPLTHPLPLCHLPLPLRCVYGCVFEFYLSGVPLVKDSSEGRLKGSVRGGKGPRDRALGSLRLISPLTAQIPARPHRHQIPGAGVLHHHADD